MHKRLRIPRRRLVIALLALLVTSPGIARAYLHFSSGIRIHTDLNSLPHCRVALVLGAGVKPNGRLSTLLKDRADAAIELYRAGKVDKLLMSGDNRVSHYNEPMRLRDYAVAHGVRPEDVLMDFAGRRTYDSVYRAKHIFRQDRLIIVSQRFHLDRAIFLSRHIGVRAYGLGADKPKHFSLRAHVRELGASAGALVDVYLRHPRPVMGRREPI